MSANNGTGVCCTVDHSTIMATIKASWCAKNYQTCNTLYNSDTFENECNLNSLEHRCRCAFEDLADVYFEPDLADYADTIPSFMCIEWQNNCIADNRMDTLAQQQCRTTACGSKVAKAIVPSRTTASSARSKEPTATSTVPPDLGTPSASIGVVTITPSAQGGETKSIATTLRSSDATLPTQTVETTSQNGNPEETDNPPTSPVRLDTGAKAGLAVGVIFAVLIIAFMMIVSRRKSRVKKAGEGFCGESGPSDEKQVVIPDASEISKKPELYSEPVVSFNPSRTYQNGHSDQFHQRLNPVELYSSNEYSTEFQSVALVELHSSPCNKKVEPDGILPVYPPGQQSQV